jgi:hypothetical protein
MTLTRTQLALLWIKVKKISDFPAWVKFGARSGPGSGLASKCQVDPNPTQHWTPGLRVHRVTTGNGTVLVSVCDTSPVKPTWMLLRKEMAAIFLLLRSSFCRRDRDLLAFILLLLKIPTHSTLQNDVTDDNVYKTGRNVRIFFLTGLNTRRKNHKLRSLITIRTSQPIKKVGTYWYPYLLWQHKSAALRTL